MKEGETEKSKSTEKDVIYIDLDDEITSIIDKLENSKNKVVALVLPKRPTVLQSIVNMRLLARAAKKSDKDPVLVSSDETVLPLAGAAGLHVAKNLQSKPHIPPSPIPIHRHDQATESKASDAASVDEEEIDESDAKIDYSRSIGELAAASELEEPETIKLGEDAAAGAAVAAAAAHKAKKPPKDKRLKVPNFDKFRSRLGLSIAGVFLLILFLVLATAVLPRATVTLKTTSLPLAANFNLTADGAAKSLDENKGVIPAVLQTKDQTSATAVTATGKQNNGDKAGGTVNMSAKECAPNLGQPSSVPAGTGLSANGLTYITQATTNFNASGVGSGSCVTYSAASSTPIKAQTGGSNYNTGSTSFSVSGRSDVSASGSASGGTDNVATVLSQSDVDNAKTKLTSSGSDSFAKDWQKQLESQNLYLISSTFKASDPVTTTSTPVGQPATTANLSIKVTYTILSIKKDDLKKAVTDQLNKQIDTSKQKLSGDDPLNGLSVTVQSQDSPTKAALQLSINTTAIPILDAAAIKKTVAGHKSGDIKDALANLPGVQDVSVKLSPFWVSKAPKSAGKIKVIQEQEASGNNSP